MDKTVPKGAAILLDFIRETEVGRSDRASYDVIYGHNQDKLPTPVTSMNIGDLVDAQKSFTQRFKSSASGGYQFMRATLIDLSKELHLNGRQIFDPDLQDRLAYHLLKRRGYEQYMAGVISRTEFGKRLAMEWASFPVLAATKGAHRQIKRGQSYYSGDALNKALVTPAKVEAILEQVKAAGNEIIAPVKPEPEPVPDESLAEPFWKSKRFWTWVGAGGGINLVGFGNLHWGAQLAIIVAVTGFAVYAIAAMPQVRKALGLS